MVEGEGHPKGLGETQALSTNTQGWGLASPCFPRSWWDFTTCPPVGLHMFAKRYLLSSRQAMLPACYPSGCDAGQIQSAAGCQAAAGGYFIDKYQAITQLRWFWMGMLDPSADFSHGWSYLSGWVFGLINPYLRNSSSPLLEQLNYIYITCCSRPGLNYQSPPPIRIFF